MAKKIYAKSIIRDAGDDEVQIPGEQLRGNIDKPALVSSRFQARSLAEKIACDDVCSKNYYFAGGKTEFPNLEYMWRVDLYFPYAVNGPLYVDQLTRVDQRKEEMLLEKKKFLNKKGYRYLLIKPGMTETDAIEELA